MQKPHTDAALGLGTTDSGKLPGKRATRIRALGLTGPTSLFEYFFFLKLNKGEYAIKSTLARLRFLLSKGGQFHQADWRESGALFLQPNGMQPVSALNSCVRRICPSSRAIGWRPWALPALSPGAPARCVVSFTNSTILSSPVAEWPALGTGVGVAGAVSRQPCEGWLHPLRGSWKMVPKLRARDHPFGFTLRGGSMQE